ncbi:hypothetical protein HDE_04476 [Halotydeus destructor]|nr:hypothetical protein HDE_04476 [Halotydeus destructor]
MEQKQAGDKFAQDDEKLLKNADRARFGVPEREPEISPIPDAWKDPHFIMVERKVPKHFLDQDRKEMAEKIDHQRFGVMEEPPLEDSMRTNWRDPCNTAQLLRCPLDSTKGSRDELVQESKTPHVTKRQERYGDDYGKM